MSLQPSGKKKINPDGYLQKTQLMELMLNIWKVKIVMKYVTGNK